MLRTVLCGLVMVLLTSANAYAQSTLVQASAPSPFANCTTPVLSQFGELNYVNADVEPWLAVNPRDPENLIGVWQQDRFSFGGSRGLVTGYSRDGGQTWRRTFPHFSRCSGGNPQNGGDYDRASDPWVTFSRDGTAYQIALTLDAYDAPGAVLVSRSRNGGKTWSEPVTLIRDADFNILDDKESITADPVRPEFVYAVWDRLDFSSSTGLIQGPSWFARTTDGGESWQQARAIYDPGLDASTIANQIAVLPNGDLVDLFVRFTNESLGSPNVNDTVIAVIRSHDQGVTWSQPIIVNSAQGVGVVDPKTGQFLRTGDFVPDIAVDRNTGTLYVVWEDARFSGGMRDGIALSKSVDGGLTWSAPVQVNQAPNTQAFTASVDVAVNGTVGVTYYDFRKDTANPGVLLTDYWQITSRDGGAVWKEKALTQPFDVLTAPNAFGLFLGDYQGLSHVGATFVPFFVMTNSGNLGNPTDVFVAVRGEDGDTRGNDRVEVNANPLSRRQRLDSHRERPNN